MAIVLFRVDDRLMLFFWHLADRWGRRRVLSITIAGYALFTFLSAFAPNAIVFGAGRLTIPQMARAGILLDIATEQGFEGLVLGRGLLLTAIGATLGLTGALAIGTAAGAGCFPSARRDRGVAGLAVLVAQRREQLGGGEREELGLGLAVDHQGARLADLHRDGSGVAHAVEPVEPGGAGRGVVHVGPAHVELEVHAALSRSGLPDGDARHRPGGDVEFHESGGGEAHRLDADGAGQRAEGGLPCQVPDRRLMRERHAPGTVRAMAATLGVAVPTLCQALSDNSERVYGSWA